MLITIIVITYNSSKYVLETLESAYRQTYRDIELIVSDDCSTDITFELCQQWVEEHKDRFVRTLCTQTPHNGGIVWNYNHALKHAQGEWIKYIAGDDILCDNCINILVHNINPNIFLYFGGIYHWDTKNNSVDILVSKIPNTTWKKQLQYVLKRFPGAHGAAMFIEKQHLIEIGGFDNRFPLSEDFPIVFKYLTNKLQIGLLSIPIVVWRYHGNNTSLCGNKIFEQSWWDAIKFYDSHYGSRYGFLPHRYHSFTTKYIDNNYDKGSMKRIIGYLLRLFDIVYWKRKRWPIQLFTFRTIKKTTFSPDLIANHEYDPK